MKSSLSKENAIKQAISMSGPLNNGRVSSCFTRSQKNPHSLLPIIALVPQRSDMTHKRTTSFNKITISDCTNKQSNHFYFYTNRNFHMYEYARLQKHIF